MWDTGISLEVKVKPGQQQDFMMRNWIGLGALEGMWKNIFDPAEQRVNVRTGLGEERGAVPGMGVAVV